MKTQWYRLMIALMATILPGLFTTACKNTAHGVGEDVEQIGEKIQEKTD